MKIRDSHTGKPIFTVLQIQLACASCLDKKIDCPHMYHLIPRWQSSGKHQRLKAIMQDRPDLIQSELAGLAFDSLQQCFRAADIETLYSQPCPAHDLHPDVFIFVDPAAGGPGSDYAVLGLMREKGLVTIISMDVLRDCKEPERQFQLVAEHVSKIRQYPKRSLSRITIFVERNLGFEAEHHQQALRHLQGVDFFVVCVRDDRVARPVYKVRGGANRHIGDKDPRELERRVDVGPARPEHGHKHEAFGDADLREHPHAYRAPVQRYEHIEQRQRGHIEHQEHKVHHVRLVEVVGKHAHAHHVNDQVEVPEARQHEKLNKTIVYGPQRKVGQVPDKMGGHAVLRHDAADRAVVVLGLIVAVGKQVGDTDDDHGV